MATINLSVRTQDLQYYGLAIRADGHVTLATPDVTSNVMKSEGRALLKWRMNLDVINPYIKSTVDEKNPDDSLNSYGYMNPEEDLRMDDFSVALNRVRLDDVVSNRYRHSRLGTFRELLDQAVLSTFLSI